MIQLSNQSYDCDTACKSTVPRTDLPTRATAKELQECLVNPWKVWFLFYPKSVPLPCAHSRPLSAQQETGRGEAHGLSAVRDRRTERKTTFWTHRKQLSKKKMSMYGSTSKLATMGQRSNSRPDLASASFRNEVFGGGNGFQGDYQVGDSGYTYTFSRSSMHGGGGGGQKVQVSMGGGGGGGGGVR